MKKSNIIFAIVMSFIALVVVAAGILYFNLYFTLYAGEYEVYCEISEIPTAYNNASKDKLNVDKGLSFLPLEIQEDVKDNCEISIFFGSLSESDTETSYVAGKFVPKTNSIYLKGNESYDILLHEVGHYIDSEYNITSSDEWINLFEEEKEIIRITTRTETGYQKSCPSEYFAEAFKEYFYSPKTLYDSAPQTYIYIRDFISNIAPSYEDSHPEPHFCKATVVVK